MSTFSNDKTPGNDGLTVEFYKFYWSEIGTSLVDSFNYAYFHGELSNSQRQAVITLIGKNDKDRRLIKNWRPISLVNVDVKIGSKAVAKRLETVLPHILRRRAYAPTSNTASHDNHEKINSRVSFAFP